MMHIIIDVICSEHTNNLEDSHVDEMEITSVAEVSPINQDTSIDQRIDYRWIDLRTDENQLMFKVQTCMVNAMRNFLVEKEFIEIHTPKLIGAASETGSEVFKVKYFEKRSERKWQKNI